MFVNIISFICIGFIVIYPASRAYRIWKDEETQLALKWQRNNLTYGIFKYSSQLNESTVNREVRLAFSDWSKHIPLNFRQVREGKADISIRFTNHLNASGTSSAPGEGTEILLNDDINWIEDFAEFPVLLRHEIGHSLGLDHAEDQPAKSCIMWHGKKIAQDDINGVQSLYGKREPNNKLPRKNS